MSYTVDIPLTDTENRVLDLLEQAGCDLGMADILQRLCDGQADRASASEVRSAVWRLLADHYLDMSPERAIRRNLPAQRPAAASSPDTRASQLLWAQDAPI
jgi:hypothetical protein